MKGGSDGTLAMAAASARGQRRWLAAGAGAAVAVVALRLALPWPLRAMIEPWMGGAQAPATAWPVWMAAAFLAIVVTLGAADLLERLWFARFAIGWVRQLRGRALEALGRRRRRIGSGEAVARLIGDTARIKTGVKGFLVHVATNGLMFAGVAVVLAWTHWPSGVVFAAVGLALGAAALVGARRIERRAGRYRRKEGELAQRIGAALEDESTGPSFRNANRSSARHEAAITRMQGLATWAGHAFYGIGAVAALLLAARDVAGGRLEPGALIIIAMYTLMLRAPSVQLVRQGARTGKVVACLKRIVKLIDTSPADESPRPLARGIELQGVKLRSGRRLGRYRRLGPIDLHIPAGQRIAVVGSAGSGKTTLLRLLAGLEAPSSGSILWDGGPHPGRSILAHAAAIAGDHAAWPKRRLRRVLRLTEDATSDDVAPLLQACGAGDLLGRLPDGLDTRLSSIELSSTQRCAVSVARAALSGRSLVLFDEPTRRCSRRAAAPMLESVLAPCAGATVIVTMRRPPTATLHLFDRVITLRRGRVRDDGPAGGDGASAAAPAFSGERETS